VAEVVTDKILIAVVNKLTIRASGARTVETGAIMCAKTVVKTLRMTEVIPDTVRVATIDLVKVTVPGLGRPTVVCSTMTTIGEVVHVGLATHPEVKTETFNEIR